MDVEHLRFFYMKSQSKRNSALINEGKLLIKEYFSLSDQRLFYLSGRLTGLGGPGGLSRGEMSLAEVQCHLDKEGASDLVIDLIMNTTSDRVFQESILLAIALLEGGNTTIQVRKCYLPLNSSTAAPRRCNPPQPLPERLLI